VSEACRVFGVSRKTYYEWIKKAEQYGLSALLPRERRRPISRTRWRLRRSR
jgi:transposase